MCVSRFVRRMRCFFEEWLCIYYGSGKVSVLREGGSFGNFNLWPGGLFVTVAMGGDAEVRMFRVCLLVDGSVNEEIAWILRLC